MGGIKVYVDVVASFDQEGRMRPLALVWENGRRYRIERVLDVRRAPALRSGGWGDRYTIRVNGRESYLFFEHNAEDTGPLGKWFVERRTMQAARQSM